MKKGKRLKGKGMKKPASQPANCQAVKMPELPPTKD
jgi:hypothetical protein